MNTPDLHDASLLDVVLNWGKEASAEVRFRDRGPRVVTLKSIKTTLLSCPHENHWGPSVSVNEVRGPQSIGNDRQRVEIEMQSGDTIVIEGEGFEWDAIGGASR